METKVLHEVGYKEALLGLSLSYNSEPSARVADTLAHRGNGESKFLESMQVYLDVDAPRYWRSEMDTSEVDLEELLSVSRSVIRMREK